MGFNGLIVTDAMSMSGLTLYFTQEEAGVRAFLAGADILEKPSDVDRDDPRSARCRKERPDPEARLDESVRRNARMEIRAWPLQAKDHAYRPDRQDRVRPGIRKACREIAEKAITLVRNEDACYPDRPYKAKVAVIGHFKRF